MALLPILRYPDPRLHTRAHPVVQVDHHIERLIDDMTETMYAAVGVGLAATQVDVHLRVIVIDVSDDHQHPQVFINPQITAREGSVMREEGCLSVPGIYDEVTRSEVVVVEALDRRGQSFSLRATGLLAVCVQHEMDHLEGKVFVEYLSPLKQNRIKTKMRKRARETL